MRGQFKAKSHGKLFCYGATTPAPHFYGGKQHNPPLDLPFQGTKSMQHANVDGELGINIDHRITKYKRANVEPNVYKNMKQRSPPVAIFLLP
jgi:hypothetical protein